MGIMETAIRKDAQKLVDEQMVRSQRLTEEQLVEVIAKLVERYCDRIG